MTNEEVKKAGYNATENTLNGQPFIATEVDFGKAYEKFLANGGDKEADIRPRSGVVPRTCGLCFYRSEKHPGCGGVCDNGTHEEIAKKQFGYKRGELMPEQIDRKEVGNFCSHWLDFDAE